MAHGLVDRVSGAASCGHRTLDDWTLIDRGGDDHEIAAGQVVVVLGVGHGARERLGQEAGGLAGDEAQELDGFFGREALDLARDFSHLLGRHAGETGGGVYFHDVS